MKIQSTVSAVALALLVAVGSLVLAPAAEAAGGVAPACVKRHVGSTGGMPNAAKVTLTNTCAGTKRVQVVFTHAHDSACMSIAPGRSRTVSSPIAYPFSHYDKTITC
jgi:hypothetical protein